MGLIFGSQNAVLLTMAGRIRARVFGALLGVSSLFFGMPVGNPAIIPTPYTHPPLPLVGWHHYDGHARAMAKRHGIPVPMFLRLLRVENPEGDPHARNPKSGATGLGQFMPGTAEIFDLDPKDPHASIDASARYLRDLYQQFDNWTLAVMSYNWGPGNVQDWLESGLDYDSIPRETRLYISRIDP